MFQYFRRQQVLERHLYLRRHQEDDDITFIGQDSIMDSRQQSAPPDSSEDDDDSEEGRWETCFIVLKRKLLLLSLGFIPNHSKFDLNHDISMYIN